MHRLAYLLLLLTTLTWAAAAQHALVIDAGSTGSRLHLFEYTNATDIQDLYSASIKPGISANADHPEQAGPDLKILLDQAQTELNNRHLNPQNVTLQILGTAGMRLLPEATQKAIYDNLRLYVINHYRFIPTRIETLSGHLEGLFGWLDINYLGHHFKTDRDDTLGSIDVGGGSVQIVFATRAMGPDLESLSINGRSYFVYSKSFLGLGLVEALAQVQQAACFPDGYEYAPGLKGHYDFKVCQQSYQNLIAQHEVQKTLPHLPNKTFIAFSGSYYTTKFFGLPALLSRETYEAKVQQTCHQSWNELEAANPKIATHQLAMYCANGAYLPELLFKTYGLDAENLIITAQLEGQAIDWTLGALMYQLLYKM